jgi:G3E family GTPase
VNFQKCVAATHAAESSSTAVHEIINQIAFADMVLLNKIDLVDAEKLSEVEDQIRSINCVAQIIHTRLDTEDSPQWLSRV